MKKSKKEINYSKYQFEVFKICDQVLIINQGKLIAKGKPQEVSNDPLVKEVYLGKDFIQ